MHARARHCLVHVEQHFALPKAIDQHVHGTTVQAMRAEPHQMVQQAGDFGKHHPDVLRANRHINTDQFLDRQAVRMLVAHHRHIVEPVHVR